MPTTTSFRHMKLHVKSQIVMYVNNKPSLHINLCDLFIYLLHLFIALNNWIISYIPFIAMYKQFNLVPNITFYVCCSWGCGVSVERGRLGVCGSTVVPPLWRLGGFGAVMFGNNAELGGQGFQWGNSVRLNLHHDNWKIIVYFFTPCYFDQF